MRTWVTIALAVAALLLWRSCYNWQADKCKEAGGVYLHREYKCVKGIQEIEL